MIQIEENEVVLRDQDRWLHFREPHRLIVARQLEQVVPALSEVETLVAEKGWHAAGFLSYESASAFDPALLTQACSGSRNIGFPFLWFGLYSAPDPIQLPKPAQPYQSLDWQPTTDRDNYNAAIAKIKEYIGSGKTYQVNYTMRLQAAFTNDAWEFFLQIASSQKNHAAYLDLGRYAICSASPELFFQLEGKRLLSRPMKGTVRRGRTGSEDRQRAEWLQNSEKNRAENVMIVDMIRNDLGRIASVGSVQVPGLFQLERYPTLWQMTSTVTAETNASLTSIFRALFPCASITGAPKVSTMRIIHQLETTPRKIYTGAIGYIAPERKAIFNVAIRTALIDRRSGVAEYGIGGGIVWDSTSLDEHAEALLKAKVLTEPSSEFSLFETMLWTPKEGFFLRDRHIQRLLDSADYFDFPISRRTIDALLDERSIEWHSDQRVRLLLNEDGDISIESTSYQPAQKIVDAALTKSSVDCEDVFLFHKTTRRDPYEHARLEFPDCDDVLLHNERGELTEFTIGNLVVELDGQLVTPPVECGLLPGTFRAHLVDSGHVSERVVPLERLAQCSGIFRVNSVRQWEQVRIRM